MTDQSTGIPNVMPTSIHDAGNRLATCTPRRNGGIYLAQGSNRIFLSASEFKRLTEAVAGFDGSHERVAYTTTTPAKKHARELGKLMRYPATRTTAG